MKRILLLFALLGAGRAHAQGIDLVPFRPAIDSRGFVTVNGADVLGHLQLSFGLVTTWGNRALLLPGYTIDDVVTPSLQAAFGLFHRIEVGLSLPFHLVSGAVSTQGVGNFGVHGKLRLIGGLALMGSVYLGGGGEWMGDDQVVWQPGLVAEHRFGRLRLGANAAWRRREARTFMAGAGSVTTASELPLGAGAAFAVAPERVDLVAEVYGAVPLAGQDYHPVEGTLGVKVYLAKSSYFVAGAGSSLLRPSARAYLGIVFEPRGGARRTGEIDDTPLVPPSPYPPVAAEPEAEEPIADAEDDCRESPCPDRLRVIRTETELVIHDTIHFRTGSAEILPESFPILNTVGQTLVDNADIELLEVQGHADERGADEFNLRLTQARAEAVRTYLIGRGVDGGRLVARGYGENVPVDKRHHPTAWAQNRRVQFVILRTTGMEPAM